MVLQSSGTISLADVNIELGYSSTREIQLGGADVRGLAGVPTGSIALSNLYGKAVTFTPDGGTLGAPAYYQSLVTYPNTASINITASVPATWTWTRTSNQGTSSIASGGTGPSITFSLTSLAAAYKSDTFNVTGVFAGRTKYYTIFLEAEEAAAPPPPPPPPPPSSPTYDISPLATSVNEGGTIQWTIGTSSLPSGTLYYTNSGTTVAADFTDNLNSGNITIADNSGTLTKTLSADSTTEGGETIIMQLRTGSVIGPIVSTSATVTVNDTSTTPAPPPPPPPPPPSPTYSVGNASTNEGASATVNVTTTNVANGTTLYWTVTGSDVSTTSGSFLINSNAGSFTIPAIADATTEGTETFTISIRTGSTGGTEVASSTLTINDTSTTPPPPPPPPPPSVSFSPDGGSSSGAGAVTLSDFVTHPGTASVTITCSASAVWNWTKTGSAQGVSSVATGGSSTSITLSLPSSGTVLRATTFNLNGTAGGITKYYTVQISTETGV